MAKTLQLKIGPRDIDMLSAIDRCPLTSAQLFRLCGVSSQPFSDVRDLRRRLRQLRQAGLLKSWPYAVASEGRSPHYFKLSQDGYRLLHGHDVTLPKRRFFEAISPGHNHHTMCLADIIVHLTITAQAGGHTIEQFARENSVCLKADPFTIYPDAAFVVRRSDGQTFPFCVELDNGTERVRSKLDIESIERKLRGYDAHQSQFDRFHADRYLVLLVTTRSQQRLQHMLDLAAMVMKQPNRTVFIGANLDTILPADPFQDALFTDHRCLKRTLIPMITSPPKTLRSIPHSRHAVVL